MSNINDLAEVVEQIYENFNEAKELIKELNPRVYKQWEAGGFLVDTDIVCTYPNLSECLDKLENNE